MSAKKSAPPPEPVDQHVGKLIRARRRAIGMPQDELAVAVGITFQQIQKYERGTNRVSASRLFAIARTLGVSVTSFFDGLENTGASPSAINEFGDFLTIPRSSEMIKAYRHLSAEQRRVLVDLAQVMARSGGD